MNLFKHNKQAELEDAITSLKEQNNMLLEEIADYKKTISTFPGVKMEYDARLVKMSEAHKKEVKELNALLEAKETSVNRRVNEALSRIGVASFVPEEMISTPTMQPRNTYEKFVSLKGAEQTEFYRKHEKEISTFLNAKQ